MGVRGEMGIRGIRVGVEGVGRESRVGREGSGDEVWRGG